MRLKAGISGFYLSIMRVVFMKDIKLTNRLAAIAAYAVNFERVADIGTDHCYVPVWLLRSGKVKQVYASDINKGPLQRARETAEEYGIKTGLELVLSDGMSHLNPDSVDAIIVAGMGGETIAGILSASDWIGEGRHALILQPMTKTEELIRWLHLNGLRARDAALAEDEGEIYLIILAGPGEPKPSVCELYVPEVLAEKRDPLLGKYLDRQIRRITSAVEGLKSSRAPNKDVRLTQLEPVLEGLIKMRGEVEYANCE
jgi:tRNA (adenine22-N1)-methyltransferase